MSTSGKSQQLSNSIRRAIHNVAVRGRLDRFGNLKGTSKVEGYVCAIHEDGELKGTVDVQEYNYETGEYDYEGAGHHEGVLLSAIQDNSGGVVIVPLMYSDVVITMNPSDGREYVVMYSRAKVIQLQAHEEISLGVTEYEDFEETDDGLEKDYDELEEKGKKSSTHYKADSIETSVTENDKGVVEKITAKEKTIEVGNTKIFIDGDNVTIETKSKVQFKVGGSTITEEDGKVNIETKEATVKANTVKVDSSKTEVKGSQVIITGGQLKVQGQANTDLNGPFNPIKVCPFSGAPHCGSTVAGT